MLWLEGMLAGESMNRSHSWGLRRLRLMISLPKEQADDDKQEIDVAHEPKSLDLDVDDPTSVVSAQN
jgi:hypothetical protein